MRNLIMVWSLAPHRLGVDGVVVTRPQPVWYGRDIVAERKAEKDRLVRELVDLERRIDTEKRKRAALAASKRGTSSRRRYR